MFRQQDDSTENGVDSSGQPMASYTSLTLAEPTRVVAASTKGQELIMTEMHNYREALKTAGQNVNV